MSRRLDCEEALETLEAHLYGDEEDGSAVLI